MSRANGCMRTCDRCGKQVFLKCVGEGEMDGGFTRWNKFEEATGWSVEEGDLCPDCTKQYKAMITEFWATAVNEEKRM